MSKVGGYTHWNPSVTHASTTDEYSSVVPVSSAVVRGVTSVSEKKNKKIKMYQFSHPERKKTSMVEW